VHPYPARGVSNQTPRDVAVSKAGERELVMRTTYRTESLMLWTILIILAIIALIIFIIGRVRGGRGV
jgi:hypothetical protein